MPDKFTLSGKRSFFEQIKKSCERTMAGLAAARKRGRLGGRPTKLDEQRIKEIRILFNDPDMAVNDIAKRYGVSRATIYRVLRAA